MRAVVAPPGYAVGFTVWGKSTHAVAPAAHTFLCGLYPDLAWSRDEDRENLPVDCARCLIRSGDGAKAHGDLRKEMLHVAAVAVGAIETLDYGAAGLGRPGLTETPSGRDATGEPETRETCVGCGDEGHVWTGHGWLCESCDEADTDDELLICPACGQPMLSADERCSGSFLDIDHPASVAPVPAPCAIVGEGEHFDDPMPCSNCGDLACDAHGDHSREDDEWLCSPCFDAEGRRLAPSPSDGERQG